MLARVTKMLAELLGLAPRRRVRRLAPPPVRPAVGQGPAAPRSAPPPNARPTTPRAPDPEARRRALFAAFSPSRPVELREDLKGRAVELDALLTAVIDQHEHALVYGARGSGKTSLVRVFGDHADERGVVTIYLACDPTSSFAGLITPYLRFIPDSSLVAGQGRSLGQALDALGADFGPRDLASLLIERTRGRLIFILDEYDRVQDARVQDELATFMKLLSDAHAPLQLVVVGIAATVGQLIGHHPSLRRHLAAIGIQRIGESGVRDLIKRGSERSGIEFLPSAIALVEQAAAGSPYHVRLFCHHAGLAALARGRTTVDERAMLDGFAAAVQRWTVLNEEDGALFQQLAQDESARPTLARIARQAAADDGFTPVDPSSLLLDEALVEDGRRAGRLLFRDPLAPQFLLASIALAGRRVEAQPLSPGEAH